MLTAHGPLGYLIAHRLRPRESRWFYMAGIIGGLFPDVDLFYYYLVDASASHRLLPTHSFISYFILAGIGYGLSRRQRFSTVGWIVLLFALGAISHILADMVVGMTMGLAPFSSAVFGLFSLPWLAQSWFNDHTLLVNYGAEYGIWILAILTAVRWKKQWVIGAGVVSVVAVFSLLYLDAHVFRPNGTFYYSDPDRDGLITTQDRDSDGDGQLNMRDSDIDNDGRDNGIEFEEETVRAIGALYDTTEGRYIEIPLRIGLVTAPVLIERLYGNVGIFFAMEMAQDYAVRPDGYRYTPKDNRFNDVTENWQTWLKNMNHLRSPESTPHNFDIVFFSSGHVGIIVHYNDVISVLEAHRSHAQVEIVPLAEVIAREGTINSLGRILP